MNRYDLDMTLSPTQSSEEEDSEDSKEEDRKIHPQSLLNSAIQKRYELHKTEGANLRCETLQTMFIAKLHWFIKKKKNEKQRKRSNASSSVTSSDESSDGTEGLRLKRKSIGTEDKMNNVESKQ